MSMEEWLSVQREECKSEIVNAQHRIQYRAEHPGPLQVITDEANKEDRALCRTMRARVTMLSEVAEWWDNNCPLQDEAELAHIREELEVIALDEAMLEQILAGEAPGGEESES